MKDVMDVTELLVLSKLDYADIVFMPNTNLLANHLPKVQNSAASFVFDKFSKEKDVIGLGWLTMRERRELQLFNL